MVRRRNFFPDHQQHNLLPSHQGTGSSSPQYCTWPNWSSVIDQYWLSLTSDQSPCFHHLRRIDVKKRITSLPHRACRRNHPLRWTKATCQEPCEGFNICFLVPLLVSTCSTFSTSSKCFATKSLYRNRYCEVGPKHTEGKKEANCDWQEYHWKTESSSLDRNWY